jgi:hypothetical protein
MSNNFISENSAVYEIILKNMVEPERLQFFGEKSQLNGNLTFH